MNSHCMVQLTETFLRTPVNAVIKLRSAVLNRFPFVVGFKAEEKASRSFYHPFPVSPPTTVQPALLTEQVIRVRCSYEIHRSGWSRYLY